MIEKTIPQADLSKNWRKTALLAFGLGMVSLMVSLWALYHPDDPAAIGPLPAVAVLYIAFILTPVAIAIGALRGTRQALRIPATMQTTSDISALAQINRLINDALYRSRALVIIVIGTMPVMVFFTFDVRIRISAIFINIIGCGSSSGNNNWACITFPSNGDLVNSLLALTALTVGFWGLTLLGASLGVGLALKSWYTTLLTVATIFLLLAISVWLASLLLQVAPGLHYKSSYAQAETTTMTSSNVVMLCFLIMLAPFVLAAAIMLLSQRWIPKNTTRPSV